MTSSPLLRVAIDDAGDLWATPDDVEPAEIPMLFRSGVELLGGVIWFDVREEAVRPIFTIHDWAAAQFWIRNVVDDDQHRELEELWRRDALATALDGLDDDTNGEVNHPALTLTLGATGVVGALHRCAIGHWLLRFHPRAEGFPELDTDLLSAEIASVAASLDDVLLSVQHADAMFEDLHPWLLDELSRAVPDSARSAVVLAAASAAADLGAELDAWPGLEEELASARARCKAAAPSDRLTQSAAGTPVPPGSSGSLDEADGDELTRLMTRLMTRWLPATTSSDYALAADDPDGQADAPWESLTLNWRHVDLGVVDIREGAARWAITREGPHVQIFALVPLARPEAHTTTDYVLRIFGESPGGALHPVAEAPMLLTGDWLTASKTVTLSEDWDVVVDVVDPALTGPQHPEDALTVREQSRAALGVIARRHARARTQPPGEAVDGLRPFVAEIEADR